MARAFRLLLAGRFLSFLGSSSYTVAVVLFLKERTGSGAVMGTVETLALLPGVLFSPVAGAIADAHDRKRLIVGAHLVAGATMLALASPALSALGSRAADAHVHIWRIFCATVVISLCSALLRPSVDATAPDLVPPAQLARANALLQSSFYVTTLLGSAVGGYLYPRAGSVPLVLANAATYLAAGSLALFLRIPKTERAIDAAPYGARLREGIAYLWNQRGLRKMVLCFALTNALFPPVTLSLPFFLEDTLKLPPSYYGYLMATYMAGGVLGFVAYGALATSAAVHARVFRMTLFVCAALVALVACARSALPVFVLLALVSMTVACIVLIAQTVMQKSVPPALRGRVFGAVGAVTTALMPLSFAASGVLLDVVHRDGRLMFGGVAAACFLIGLLLASDRDVDALIRAS